MGGRGDRDDAGAWRLAAKHAQLISTAQLLRLGFDDDAIRHRRGKGRLWPYRRGVWAVGHPDRSPERDRMAAVLACGEDCALAGWAAAFHLELSERDPGRFEVVGPHRGSTRKGPPDVTLHLTDHLPAEDVDTVDGVRVTSVLRTIYRGDFCWVEFKLIAEIDDGSHGTDAARAHDAIRERYLRGAGFDTVHFTLAELFGDGRVVARDLRAALLRCGWSPHG